MNKETKYVYEFGTFRIDPAARLLLHEKTPVSLAPKVFDTLLVLVRNSGELIEKEKLMKELWADTFVEESNLTYSISVLRKALGEKAPKNQYIVTVNGHGYRFVADVRRVEEKTDDVKIIKEKSDETVTEQKTTPSVAQRILKNKVAVFVLILIVFGGILVYWIINQQQAAAAAGSRLSIPAKSIAVLPFKFVDAAQNDLETKILSDEINQRLINHLSQSGGKVIASSFSSKYKDEEMNPKEVAQVLGVETILTGRVVRRGEDLQINTELINAREGTQIWGNHYNCKVTDLVSLQSEIAQVVGQKLREQLTNEGNHESARGRRRNRRNSRR